MKASEAAQRALIIDGNSIINRAFFGIKNMAAPDGFPTNAIYGFFSIYYSVLGEVKPDYVAVAFDLKGPTFRHTEFEAYKAGRKGMPDELAQQLPVVKEMLVAMGVVVMSLPGFEADDLIGTTARFFEGRGIDSFILTGDKDALQLVNDKTRVYYHGTKNKTIYTPDLVRADLGVYPDRVTDLKGLMGDSSDNIPGVPSIGKVTANKLLEQFDTIENLIAQSDRIGNARQRELIDTYAHQAVLSKRLATIETAAPIELEMADLSLKEPQYDHLVGLLQRYHLHSLLKMLNARDRAAIKSVLSAPDQVEGSMATKAHELAPNPPEGLTLKRVEDAREIRAYLTVQQLKNPIVLHLLWDKITVISDPILALGVAFEVEGQGHIGLIVTRELVAEVLACFKSAERQGVNLKVKGSDIKGVILALKANGIERAQPLFDCAIAGYLLDANRKSYAMEDLALDFLGMSVTSEEDLIGKGAKRQTYKEVLEGRHQEAMQFIAERLKANLLMEGTLEAKMVSLGLKALFEGVEMPLVRVLAHMEYDGFAVDFQALSEIDLIVTEAIKTHEAKIYTLAGEAFNINSPKQLGVILFDKLMLPVDKKTKTGYSTSHEVLVNLADHHPIVQEIIQYRIYTKLKSTYVDGLRAVINPLTKRVHSSLNQTVAATGRLSSTEPNLQNIPVRLEIGRQLRRVFVPSGPDRRLVDADYSQIELRILAHMSEDPTLKRAYTEDIDIHALTASQVFEVPLESVTSLLRSRAKEVNFGIVYGMSDFGLAENLKIPRKVAKQYIENYFLKYPQVKGFMERAKASAVESGYSETLLGRKRFIPEIKHKNFNIRQYGERMAMNTPIQGTAADVIKVAMIKVFDALETAGLKSRLILQVHDELIVDAPECELDQVQALVAKAMQSAMDLSVPLKIDMHVGNSWFEAK